MACSMRAMSFLHAADEGLTQLLYGIYPITNYDMKMAANKDFEAAEARLDSIIKTVCDSDGNRNIISVQKAWTAFRDAEAKRLAQDWTGGTGYTLYYSIAATELTLDRVRQLQETLDRLG
jgi:uncharacterized protein YecT (DUF1311 family)